MSGTPRRMSPASVPVRSDSARDRHGRGMRGPLSLPSPIARDVRTPTRREEFDALVLGLVERHLEKWGHALGAVEFGTEDIPSVPPDWGDDSIPFGALVKPPAGRPARIVVFRRPVEMRAATRTERLALVNEILIEHIADLLGKDPGDIEP